MQMSIVKTFYQACGLCFALLAITCHATPVNIHLSGLVPLTGSADDFHMRVAIGRSFLLGEPINLINGPFATDGTTTTTDSGFTVDWAGAGVTAGGPYEFGFDFLINTTAFSVTEAYWTVGGTRTESVALSLFNFRASPVPEPSSLGLLGLAGALLAARTVRRRAIRPACL